MHGTPYSPTLRLPRSRGRQKGKERSQTSHLFELSIRRGGLSRRYFSFRVASHETLSPRGLSDPSSPFLPARPTAGRFCRAFLSGFIDLATITRGVLVLSHRKEGLGPPFAHDGRIKPPSDRMAGRCERSPKIPAGNGLKLDILTPFHLGRRRPYNLLHTATRFSVSHERYGHQCRSHRQRPLRRGIYAKPTTDGI